jgi:hypothetical protein
LWGGGARGEGGFNVRSADETSKLAIKDLMDPSLYFSNLVCFYSNFTELNEKNQREIILELFEEKNLVRLALPKRMGLVEN